MKLENQNFTLKDKNTMRDDIKDIRFHMDVLNGETGELRDLYKEINKKLEETNRQAEERGRTIIQIQTDVDWLKRTYWLIAAASAGGLITGVLNLVLK